MKVVGASKSRWLTDDGRSLGLFLGDEEGEIRKNAIAAMIALDEFLHPWADEGEIPPYGIDVELKCDDGWVLGGFLVSLDGVNKWRVDGWNYSLSGPEIIGWRYPAAGGRISRLYVSKCHETERLKHWRDSLRKAIADDGWFDG